MRPVTPTMIGLALVLGLSYGQAQAQATATGGTCEIKAGSGPALCIVMKEQAACVARAKEASALYRWTSGQTCPGTGSTNPG